MGEDSVRNVLRLHFLDSYVFQKLMFCNLYSLPNIIAIIEGKRSDELLMKDGTAKGEIYTNFLSDYVVWTDQVGEAKVDDRKTVE